METPSAVEEDKLALVQNASTDQLDLIALLYRHKSPGMQYVLCCRLESMALAELIPQLVQIMLQDPISLPVYNLLVNGARRSLSFRIRLFLHLKTILSSEDRSLASWCYYICCEIFDIDRRHSKRNERILFVNHSLSERRSRCYAQSVSAGSAGLKEHAQTAPVLAVETQLDAATTATVGNLRVFRPRLIEQHRIHRTRGALVPRGRLPNFHGLFLFFVRAASVLLSDDFFKNINEMSGIFNMKKNCKNLRIRHPTESKFMRSVLFYESLTSISTDLRKIPADIRQRVLEAELAILDFSLSGVLNPFDPTKSIVSIVTEESMTLDSAANVPYSVVVEVVDKRVVSEIKLDSSIHKIEMLRGHLHSVNELSDVGDISGIRENILDALENALLDRTRELPAGGSLPDEAHAEKREESTAADSDTSAIDEKQQDWRDNPPPPSFQEVEIEAITELPSHPVAEATEDSTEQEKPDNATEAVSEGSLQPTPTAPYGDLVSEDASSFLSESATSPASAHPTSLLKPSKKSWDFLTARVRSGSKFSHLPGWQLFSVIVKSGSALRHEYLAYQIISQLKYIFDIEQTDIFIRNYKIYLISSGAGLIETITDSVSIHRIKSKTASLSAYFTKSFTDPVKARKNFLRSLVGYSLASFVLQVKDRHNGNILIDSNGHIIHVDFGFILGGHPGFYCVENAPFKFSAEYLELIEMDEFRRLFLLGMRAIQKHHQRLQQIMQIVESGGFCASGSTGAFLSRFHLNTTEKELEDYCNSLIEKSVNNMRTTVYDKFQYFSNGYY